MLEKRSLKRVGKSFVLCLAMFVACLVWMPSMIHAFTVTVVDQDGNPVSGFRSARRGRHDQRGHAGHFFGKDPWREHPRNLCARCHVKGRSSTSSANIKVSSDTRWLVSVLPDAATTGGPRFTMSGKLVDVGVRV